MLGMVGVGNPELLGVVEDPNDARDPHWQSRLNFEVSPLGGKWRLDKLNMELLSFYLTGSDEESSIEHHVDNSAVSFFSS